MKKIKAVIFDIDGVLIDSVEANATFFERIFKALNVSYSKKEYIKLNHMTMWDIIKYFTKEIDDKKVKKLWKFGLSIPYPTSMVKTPKDAKKVVSALAKSYKLGLVTARQKLGVKLVLEIFGHKSFKAIVKFGDYIHPKPHPEPLLKALKMLKVKKQEAIYIGDMRSDVLCAQAAGVKSILFKNHYSDLKKEKPDYTVTSFKQLLELFHAR